VGPRVSGQVRNISPPLGFDPRAVQPVASRYTDNGTRPTSPFRLEVISWLFTSSFQYVSKTRYFVAWRLICGATALHLRFTAV
jgi:hypothetical protein